MPITLLAPPAWLVREQAIHLLRWLLTPHFAPVVEPTDAQIEAMIAAIHDGRVAQAFEELEQGL